MQGHCGQPAEPAGGSPAGSTAELEGAEVPSASVRKGKLRLRGRLIEPAVTWLYRLLPNQELAWRRSMAGVNHLPEPKCSESLGTTGGALRRSRHTEMPRSAAGADTGAGSTKSEPPPSTDRWPRGASLRAGACTARRDHVAWQMSAAQTRSDGYSVKRISRGW